MRALYTAGLSLGLGCLVGAAQAGDPVWRPATAQTAAAAWPTPPRATPTGNGVTLERPRPIAAAPEAPRPRVDPAVHRAAYRAPGAALARPIIRAQSSDASPPMLPAPVWPADSDNSAATLPTPNPVPVGPQPTLVAPGPGHAPPAATAPPGMPAMTTITPYPGVPTGEPTPVLTATKPAMTTVDAMLPTEEEIVTSEAMYADANRFWLRGEYLLWDIKNDSYPVLAATGPVLNPDFPLDRLGILGNRGTTALFGGGDVDSEMRHGARFSGGYWFDPCNQVGVDASVFFLGERSVRFSANSGQFPVITRPFRDVLGGVEGSEAVAAPGFFQGRISIDAPSRLWGADVNLRKNWLCGCFHRVDLLAGFRYLDLEESLRIREDIQANINPQFLSDQDDPIVQRLASFNGSNLIVLDQFSTRNRFYGGQLGTAAEWRRGRWVVDFRGKVALGVTHQTVDINGGTVITRPGGAQQTFAGGLLTAPSNIGHYSRDRFSVVPEVGLTLGYQLTDHMKILAGYNFLYWTNVARPGGQIDRNVNTNLIPSLVQTAGTRGGGGGPPLPAPQLRDSDFWAHGVSFGLEFTY
jgi:hypothetical protein